MNRWRNYFLLLAGKRIFFKKNNYENNRVIYVISIYYFC